MSVEFRVTSGFRELAEIAEARNASPEWRGVLEIKPSVTRIVRLRGRLPGTRDVPDIQYDLRDFGQIDISTEELVGRLSQLVELESTYYPLAENFAVRAAYDTGQYSRIPDFVDAGKDLAARTVWYSWRPEKGDDFITLHRRIKAQLNRALKSFWYESNFNRSFSGVERQELERANIIDETDNPPHRPKPRTRLRQATQHLSLPSVVATLDECEPLEQIASLAVLGYYPDGRGFIGVAKQIGTDRLDLSYALNRSISRLTEATNGLVPRRSITEIVQDLVLNGRYRYKSGVAVARTSPRFALIRLKQIPDDLPPLDRKILELAIKRNGNVLVFSNKEEIAKELGIGKEKVFRTVKRLASSLQQSSL